MTANSNSFLKNFATENEVQDCHPEGPFNPVLKIHSYVSTAQDEKAAVRASAVVKPKGALRHLLSKFVRMFSRTIRPKWTASHNLRLINAEQLRLILHTTGESTYGT